MTRLVLLERTKEMVDFIIVAVLLVVVGGAVIYIVSHKKKGDKCIGCMAAGACTLTGKCKGDSEV
jgi:prolipoprotein diacylglyceryltransferase